MASISQKRFKPTLALIKLISVLLFLWLNSCKSSLPDETKTQLQELDSLNRVLEEQYYSLSQINKLNTDSLVSVLIKLQDAEDSINPYREARTESINNAKKVFSSFKQESSEAMLEIKSTQEQLKQLKKQIVSSPTDSVDQKMLSFYYKTTDELHLKSDYYLNRINAQLLLVEQLTQPDKPLD